MRLITTCSIFIISTFGFSSPASAGFKTGNDILTECSADRSQATYYQNSAYCVAYVVGVVDDEALYADFTQKRLYCLPAEVTSGQIKDVVVASLQRHPEKRHLSAASLVAAALIEAFPCS